MLLCAGCFREAAIVLQNIPTIGGLSRPPSQNFSKRTFAGSFEFVREIYGGNLGFLLVFNSLVLRIPLQLKRFYSPAVLRLEAMLARLQRKRSACTVICQWRKK
jgi:hypothetical protein